MSNKYKVSSEIYKETNFESIKTQDDNKVVSKFRFQYPVDDEARDGDKKSSSLQTVVDKDGDMVVQRKPSNYCIEIEHSEATEIKLVGLQVWRGALLLADFIYHNRHEFAEKQILELGAGVGLTSIAAAIFVHKVICTDVDIGGILKLIRANVRRNQSLLKGTVDVVEFDFMQNPSDYNSQLSQAIADSEIIVAADVIYDDDLTDAFVKVLERIFASKGRQPKTVYIALEKRYVFTLSELDAVAPMFEYFLQRTVNKPWKFEYIAMDKIPQYFEYERCPQLVLLKVTV